MEPDVSSFPCHFRLSSNEMWCLSRDFLQRPHNLCKSQMHVLLQKGKLCHFATCCFVVLCFIIKNVSTCLNEWKVKLYDSTAVCSSNDSRYSYFRIFRSLYVHCATLPSPPREERCQTLKLVNTLTETVNQTRPREKERFISFLFGVVFNPANSLEVSVHFNFSYFQIFTNKCSKGSCKQKEMMRVTCDQCHLNFCLKHRHPLDHDCKTDGKPLSKSGWVESHDPFTFLLLEFRWLYIVHLYFHPLMCDFFCLMPEMLL